MGIRDLTFAAGSALLGVMIFGVGVTGVFAGVLIFGGALITLRLRPPQESRRDTARILADLPLAADLTAACLRAGRPLTSALEATAVAIGGPLGDRLAWVTGQLRLGAAPEEAWSSLLYESCTAQLARTMVRASTTGSPVADALTRLADDASATARATSSAAARRVGIQAVAPLGLCFLPAFILLGIVPVIAVLAARVLIV
ncbi:type II secretion system F family protein [Spongiactinospora sp. TRM90649]|uniref:type II secretion system F family protein n=1 Tax=Spongiactinospora sp. TRM90649 TaxID=3031114 RepID=UPI0023F83275|nr:type II secretion system F family protein [Spongiactinospora sp. TRM90649]MDF5754868.1 type II secretion system F family protein [Spongiactinospora sp. TRM90649]